MEPVVIPKRFTKYNSVDQSKLLSLVTQMKDLVIGISSTSNSYIIDNLNDTEFELYVQFVEAFENMDSQFIEYLIQTFGVYTKKGYQEYSLVFNATSLFNYNLVEDDTIFHPFTMQKIHVQYVNRIVTNLGFVQHPKNSYNEYNSATDTINSYIDSLLYSKKIRENIQGKWQVIPIKSFCDYN